MPRQDDLTFLEENARLIFLNFTGKPSQYNRAGDRNFAIVLDDAKAEELNAQGWNVKWMEPREEGDPGWAYIQVAVSYNHRPPNITLITSKGRSRLTEDMVEIVDQIDIAKADIFCRAYRWEVGDKSGIKAYLKTAFITLDEDPLERKYGVSFGEPEDEDGD